MWKPFIILILTIFVIIFFRRETEIISLSSKNKNQKLTYYHGYHLIWSDEFDSSYLNKSKWNIINKPWQSDNELEYYIPNDVSVTDGKLRITSEKREFRGRHYTSGRIDTKGKFSFTYGRIDIRAKLPKGKGIWPSHWLLPTKGYKWEIDQMEMIGSDSKTIYLTNHYLKTPYSKDGGFSKKTIIYKSQTDLSEDSHLYSVIWEPGKLTYLLDNRVIGVSMVHVPNTPAYIVLNTAVGGIWPGNPDKTTKFPVYQDIDYVRVYQKN